MPVVTVRRGAGSSAGPWGRSRYTAEGDATVLSLATKARVVGDAAGAAERKRIPIW